MSKADSLSVNENVVDYRAAFESVPGKFLLLEPQFPYMILAISNDLIAMVGKEREIIVGQDLMEFYRSNTTGTSLRDLERSVLQGKNIGEVIITRFKNKESEDLYQPFCSATNKPVLDAKGELLFIIHTIKDLSTSFTKTVTEADEKTSSSLVTALEAGKDTILNLEVSEKNLRNLILQAPVAICIFRGADYVVEIVNELMLKSWDKKAEDVLNKPVYDALPEARGQGFEDLLHRVYTTGETITAYEVAGTLTRNGINETYYVDLVYQALREPDGRISGIMIINIDVTEQVLSRKKIEEAEERARLAVESAELGTYAINLHTNELFASARLAKIFEVENDADRSRYVSAIHRDDLKTREAAYQRAYESGILEYEVRLVKKDGSTCWIRAKGKIYFDQQNVPNRLLGVVQDITAEKETNRQKDDFISVVSHELKTPITSLKGYTQILNRKFRAVNDEQATSMLSKMDEQVKRLHYIVQDLLDVTRIEGDKIKFRIEEFGFNELVAQTVEDVQRTTDLHTITLETCEEIKIWADKERTSQVLVNLLSNAINYSPGQSQITVSVTCLNGEIICAVKDFGPGIEKSRQTRIFERYYRASEVSTFNAGLGLGLFISSEIIKRQNGKIWVESEPGKGATFYFSLPVSSNVSAFI